MKKPDPNPTHVPKWDARYSYAYLVESYNFYYHYVRKGLDGWGQKNLGMINYLFREGRSRKVLACDYESFVRLMLYGVDVQLSPDYTRWYPRWGRYFNTPYRHKLKYQKNKSKTPEKKNVFEMEKKEWREHKGVRRDKAKISWSQSRRGPSKWMKRWSNKMNRQHGQRKIHKLEWGDLGNKDYKYFLDSGMWD